MVPAAFVFLPSLPLTPSGKVDRNALPEPNSVRPAVPVRLANPRNSDEERLLAIWQDVLSRTDIGVNDDYFELGGHSLLAVRLMARVEREFGIRLPLAHLLGNPTIDKMARTLRRQAGARRWEELVEIRPGGSRPPLFLLPGAGGNVVYYRPLANRMNGERPIYGLQALGLDGSTAPLTRVEDIAARNVEAVRSVAGDGPYYFVGHSFGAAVGLEMSRQLAHRNLEVGMLGILDAPAPLFGRGAQTDGWDDARWLAAITVVVGAFIGADLAVAYEELAGLDEEARLNLVIERIGGKGASLAGVDPVHLRAYLNVYKANVQAEYRPVPGIHRVPIVLFKASASQPDEIAPSEDLSLLMQEPAWGWTASPRARWR